MTTKLMMHSPSPWEYIPSNKNHGAYVLNGYGREVCDCYVMSKPGSWAVCNGGDSEPVPFDDSDANAMLIAVAPEMLAHLRAIQKLVTEAAMTGFNCQEGNWAERLFASQVTTHELIRKATKLEKSETTERKSCSM